MMQLIRTSSAYEAHVAAGASFADKKGWRRVNYFGVNEGRGDSSRRPAGPGSELWSAAIEAEHRAVRERVGLFDLTSFGKVQVTGGAASEVLEKLCTNIVSRGPGILTYTQMLNEQGGVIADVTVAHVDDDSFLVVTGTSALDHDLERLRRYAQERDGIQVHDVTSGFVCYGVWGPFARDVLQPLVDVSLDSTDFPYMTTETATIGGAHVRLSRVTFVGELGWEIYAPSEYGASLWTELEAAVQAVDGLRCGYRAIDSLRSEKGYLYLGVDLPATRTPLECGLGMFMRPVKEFVGRDAVLAKDPPTEVLRALTLDDEWYAMQGGEVVQFPSSGASTITSAGLAYTLGQAVGFAFMPAEIVPGTAVKVLLGDRTVSATVVAQPLYDPKGMRIRA